MPLAQKLSVISGDEVNERMRRVPQWSLHGKSIFREYNFKDFKQAMNFTNRVAQMAEAQDHHPDIYISYSKVKLELSTHKAGGLTHMDFDLAEKINQIM